MTATGAVRPLPAPHPDPDRGPRRTVTAMVALIALFLLTTGVWALLAGLDVAVQARGSVIPPRRLQAVQSLEGGIVEQLLVVPRQAVKKGQLLALLDGLQYTASAGESRQHWLAAVAGRARVEAPLSGQCTALRRRLAARSARSDRPGDAALARQPARVPVQRRRRPRGGVAPAQ